MSTGVSAPNSITVAEGITVGTDPAEMAAELQDLLGQKLVAFALGDRHPKSIGRYARGEREPEEDALTALMSLYTVAGVLKQGRAEYGSWIKQWMIGANHGLGGRAPIQVFHDGNRNQVLGAAAAFIASR
jgi:hypothetical protein